ncbi:hypothetical protein GCM10011487_29160 [Steroidobacter agaridevorans]|uniref:Ice-binding protein C-terminal domain-containing protein n=1 Tax=Steroidobacter agaridevorans TaxID=2695856 RepID=A0A829YE67_9GAMM|nr:PEP-CTERM sorting domain-containing protein [Steroidobacter agaridevorans]GFE80916.1 hypothetical protein GCM10011487_29160 [Steroidobacter agaridevorans]
MNRIFAFVLLAFGFASAHAVPTTWTDSADIGGRQYIDYFQSYTYTHDLADTGFNSLTDVINTFSLSINLADDRMGDGFLGVDLLEWALVDLPGEDGDVYNFNVWGDEFGGVSFEGLAQLNEFGTLTVTIHSLLGDFYLLGSTLTARGESNAANVPEPSALGLLGIGLVGIALSRRRRKQAA